MKPGRAQTLPQARWLGRAPGLLTLAFGIPVLIGVVVGLVRLFETAHPFGGDTASIDAQQFYLWRPFYQDPNRGYSATAYTPLLPVLAGLLDHAWFWRGWAPALSLFASIAMIGLAAWLAFDPTVRGRAGRTLGLLGAIGAGGLAWWLVAGSFGGYFTIDRPDQLAWTFALIGLVLTPAALAGSRRAGVASILLLSAGFWTKQTALAVVAAALIFAGVATFLRWAERGRALLFALLLLAVNLVVLAVLAALTSGWSYYYNFVEPSQSPCCELSLHLGQYVQRVSGEFFAALLLPLGVAAALGVVVLATRRGRRRPGADGAAGAASWEARTATALGIFAVIGVVAAAYARKNYGSASNQAIGVSWALALLAMLALRVLGRDRRTILAVAAAVLGLVVVSQVGPRAGTVGGYPFAVSPLRPDITWVPVPPARVDYGRTHTIYDPVYSDLSVAGEHVLYPAWINFSALLSVGREPGYLRDAILGRRFDAVVPFDSSEVKHPLSSGGGKYEENYLWKLNQAMKLGYRPSSSAPPGVLVRIPGPDPAPWVNRCFGPFVVEGIRLRQHQGGGFWCPSGSSIALRDTPADVSSLRTEQDVHALSGSLGVTLPHGTGAVEIFLERGESLVWRLDAYADSGGAAVASLDSGTPVPGTIVSAAGGAGGIPLRIDFVTGERLAISSPDPGVIRAVVPRIQRDVRLSFAATRGSAARFDFSALRVR